MEKAMSSYDEKCFILKIKNLLEKSNYSGTYKPVLLIALTLIAKEKNISEQDSLEISFKDITEKMITLYWPFVDPSIIDPQQLGIANSVVLRQFPGQKSTLSERERSNENDILKNVRDLLIVNKLLSLRSSGDKELLKDTLEYQTVVESLIDTIRDKPISLLQMEEKFLYSWDRSKLTLNKGIAHLLSENSDEIIALCESKWMQLMIKFNGELAIEVIRNLFSLESKTSESYQNHSNLINSESESNRSKSIEADSFKPFSKTEVEKAKQEEDIEYELRAKRKAQSLFRELILKTYERKCCVTGIDTIEVLQAAHIQPYVNPLSHNRQNGLLLSAEMHLLYDKGLMTIIKEDDNTYRVFMHEGKVHKSYYDYNKKLITLPQSKEDRPSARALAIQNELFEQKYKSEASLPEGYKQSKKMQDAYIELINSQDMNTNTIT